MILAQFGTLGILLGPSIAAKVISSVLCLIGGGLNGYAIHAAREEGKRQ